MSHAILKQFNFTIYLLKTIKNFFITGAHHNLSFLSYPPSSTYIPLHNWHGTLCAWHCSFHSIVARTWLCFLDILSVVTYICFCAIWSSCMLIYPWSRYIWSFYFHTGPPSHHKKFCGMDINFLFVNYIFHISVFHKN